MQVLIVEPNAPLGEVWAAHLRRGGAAVSIAHGQAEAIRVLRNSPIAAVVLNLMLDEGSAFAIADYASYARPEAKVIFVTNSKFFSDGSIFRHIPNAAAYLPSTTRPEDLAAMVEHYAARAEGDAARAESEAGG